MNVGDKYKVTIEKITSEGKGLTHINNFVVFVNDACPKDVAEIIITKINKHFAYGKIETIIKPSEHRVEPFCPMQKVCGACQIQYIDYIYQLKLKQEITSETISKIAKIDLNIPLTIASPVNREYRHKIQYPVSETKNSKRILAGYYKSGSHEIVNTKYCPIQPQICDDIIEYIRQESKNCNVRGYIESSHSGELKHVVIRHSNSNKKILVVLVINSNKINTNVKQLANNIFKKFEEVQGVCVNLNSKKTNIILGHKTICLEGKNYIEEIILDKTFVVGAETFFQVNPQSAENIFRYVKNYTKDNFNNPLILDAYAGISAFGICLADVADKVVSIEENLQSVKLAKQTAQKNNINNIEINGGDAAEFLSKEKRRFDVIILDPPRKGCTQQSLDEAVRLCKGSIVYVSCNPATLARDLKYLKDIGCIIQSIQPFDMFCHTVHIENVAIISCP